MELWEIIEILEHHDVNNYDPVIHISMKVTKKKPMLRTRIDARLCAFGDEEVVSIRRDVDFEKYADLEEPEQFWETFFNDAFQFFKEEEVGEV